MRINTICTLGPGNLVTKIEVTDGDQVCTGTINEDNSSYTYTSDLLDGTGEITAPMPMSLADCILAAHVHLGVIPPHIFAPIASPNKH